MDRLKHLARHLFFSAGTELALFCLFCLLCHVIALSNGLNDPWKCLLAGFLTVRCVRLAVNFFDPVFYRDLKEEHIGTGFFLFSVTALTAAGIFLVRNFSLFSGSLAR